MSFKALFIKTIVLLRSLKAILSTGYHQPGINYKKYGFLGILLKPYTFNELKQVISSVEKSSINRDKKILIQKI